MVCRQPATRLSADGQWNLIDRIIAEIDEWFGIEIADEELMEIKTVDDLARLVDRLVQGKWDGTRT